MANIPLLLLAVLEICVAAAIQGVQYYPPPVPSGKTRKHPRTYHKYEGLHFSTRQCSEIKSFKNKPLEFCAGECDHLGTCTAFNYKEHEGEECSLRACGFDLGLNIPYPIGGVYGGASKDRGWSGYTLEEIPVGYTYYHGPYKNYFGHQTQCRHLHPTLNYKNYVLCEEACDEKPKCTGFNFNIHTFDCELRGCSSADSRPGEYLEEWESWSKAEIKNPEPDPKCPSHKCPQYRFSIYYGPYGYWDRSQGCKKIGDTLIGKTNILCEEACDKISECTGFNYKNADCELQGCPSPVTIPFHNTTSLWKGYSKKNIPRNKARPYYEHSIYHFSGRQCSQINIEKKPPVPFEDCASECDYRIGCTAFNYKQRGEECSLRSCGVHVPYPIGALFSEIKSKGWKGYALEEIPGKYSYYDGPYGLYWGYACPQIGTDLEDATYVLCEEYCDRDPRCTGFNFNIVSLACELRKCPTPTTKPTDWLWQWESWSKLKINASPPKCPSFKCGPDTIIPKHTGEKLSDQKLRICSQKNYSTGRCKCDIDSWCYHNCEKCEVDGRWWLNGPYKDIFG